MPIKINHFHKLLADTATLADAELILKAYLAGFGIKSYAFTYYSGSLKYSQKLHYDHVSPALQPWHDHYLAQDYADVDRTLEKSYTASLPVYWDLRIQLSQAKNKREQRIRLESIEFGLDKGLSIPMHGPHYDFATLVLHQRHDETCLMDYTDHQFEWMSAAQLFYACIARLVSSTLAPHHPVHLTKREKECLNLTAKSWRVEQIAEELKITPRTVNFHLQNINKKLGVHNKYLAVYNAHITS